MARPPAVLGADGKPWRESREGREHARQQAERYSPMARVDAAQTTDENRRHWSQADNFSANAAYDERIRFHLRNRSRYEALNNCYAKGDIVGSADDLIGTGPRIQISVPGMAKSTKAVEVDFRQWSDETKLAWDLHLAEKSRRRDGECYGVFDTNERLQGPVKFDLRWLEAELCATPYAVQWNSPFAVDGIKFDRFWNPIEYSFLKNHPGDTFGSLAPLETYIVPADQVIHWFVADRIGQQRGIPDTTPALPLYSQLRRYTLATLTAAEFAAMIAGIMKSNLPTDENTEEIPRFDPIEMIRGALLTLPAGYEASQFSAQQPTTNYGEFKREILNESGRASSKPLNAVTGNSSGYNYSSGRLDHLPYQRSLRIIRNFLRLGVLDRIFREWYREAAVVGLIPADLPPISEWKWSWNWDGFDSIDQNKDAQADDMRLRNGTQTYHETYAAYGQDSEDQLDQLATEVEGFRRRGLRHPMDVEMGTAKPGEKSGDARDKQDAEENPPRNGHNGHRFNGHFVGGRS